MVRVWKTIITIILFKIRPTNRFSKAKSYNFHFHKNNVTWPLSASSLWGTWPADIMTDWATDRLADWLTVQLGTWLADRMTDWSIDWMIDKLSNSPSDWITESNWRTDLGTDWVPQSRGQFNKTFTSVINLSVNHCFRVCVNHTLNKWTSLLHSNKLQVSVFSHRGFL